MTSTSGPDAPAPARLSPGDLTGLASVGLRTRKLRAALSALGIAIGVAAIVAVLGLASSSQAGLLAEISRLGTNLLTVTNGADLTGQTAELPDAAPSMIGRLPGVIDVQYTGTLSSVSVYRSPLIPSIDTDGLTVTAASLGLPAVIGTSVAQGSYLNAATAREPVAVLGAEAAQLMGIDRIWPGERIYVGGMWFYVVGILNPVTLAPQIDTSVLTGFPAAEQYLGLDGHPSEIYVRTVNTQAATTAVDNLLGAQANPENPNEVNVSQPSDALTAQADAAGAFDTLFLGLGAVALLVGAVGVANIMIISVLERRQEIGLRRALGATKGQIRTQFLAEAILLALAGGAAGDIAGAAATVIYAHLKGWPIVIPPEAWAGGLGAALLIGALAGLLPAIRAARLSPTQALWTLLLGRDLDAAKEPCAQHGGHDHCDARPGGSGVQAVRERGSRGRREFDAQPRGQLAGHAERAAEGVTRRGQSRMREPGGRGMCQVSPVHGDADAAEYRHAERAAELRGGLHHGGRRAGPPGRHRTQDELVADGHRAYRTAGIDARAEQHDPQR